MDWLNWEEREELYHKVISLDSNFVPAYNGIASIWIYRGGFHGYLNAREVIENAMPFLNKALNLNYDYSDVHSSLAYLKLFYEWDFNAAMEEFNIAVQLNPSDINAIPTNFLWMMGNFEEATDRANIGYSIDPNSFIINKGFGHYFMDQDKEALEMFQTALKTRPDDIFGTGKLGLYLNRYDDVIRFSEQWLNNRQPLRIPVALGILAIANYHTDHKDKVAPLLEELKRISEGSPGGSPAYFAAMVYAQMGEKELAFEWLEKAYNDHEVEMVWLKVEPPFAPLHHDHRWQEMLDKVGFPES